MQLMIHLFLVAVRSYLLPDTFHQLPFRLVLSSAFLFLVPSLGLAQEHVIDFENIGAGQRVDVIQSTQGYGGIQVFGAHDSCPLRNTAIIYDSDCPNGCTGGDDDLGTPNTTFGGPGLGVGGEQGSPYENNTALGGLLAIHQYCNDLDNLPVQNPRNYGGGSVLTLTFPTPVTFVGMTMIDVESNEILEIEYFDAAGASLGSQASPVTGDNGVAEFLAETAASTAPEGVTRVVLTREGSGAIDNLRFDPEEADLSLTAMVDNPAPDKGADVTFTLTLTNDGPDDATQVTVDYLVPDGLVPASTDGASTMDGYTVFTWEVGDLAVGDSTQLDFQTLVDTDSTREIIAEVATSDQWDPDSTPGNGVPEEDDQDTATVTPGESSGGGDGGIESDGNMATQLARRLFHRRIDAQTRRALQRAPEALLFESTAPAFFSKASAASSDLREAIPPEGLFSTVAYEVSPRDLIGITNATSVLAVDYVQVDGRRLGAVFSAVSPAGSLYDHSKTSCDRLSGGRLEDVRLIEAAGHPFVLSKLIHQDGSVDYSISLVAYRSGNTYTIDSRFSPEEYEIPGGVDEILNLQVWGVAPEFARHITEQLLERLAAGSSVVFENSARQAPRLFVVDGYYRQGQVTLRFANRAGQVDDVVIRGTYARTEEDADAQVRIPFEQRVSLEPTSLENPYSAVTLDLGALFDVTLFVEHKASKSSDQLYHADGVWSYASGNQARIDRFQVRAHEERFATNTYAIERSGSLSGAVTDWASLFKYLRPGGQPVDLSAYSHLSFMASGAGEVRLVVEKVGIDTWDQYGYTFSLTPEQAYYRIDFDELRKETRFDADFTAEDVTLLAFYALGDGSESTPFEMNIDQLAFGGATREGEAELPYGFALEQNFPNPFNPTTQLSFDLEAPMDVRLAVYDMLGREVAVLLDGLQPEGRSTVTFDAQELPSGLYLYRIETPRGSTARMMSLVK